MNNRIQELEHRVKELETKLELLLTDKKEATTLVSPVKIVDQSGRLIVEIIAEENDNAIRIFNSDGHMVTSLGVDGTQSGYLAIRNRSGGLVAYLDVEAYGARLMLKSNQAKSAGVALFGADSDNCGGGINIIPAGDHGGITLWASQHGGEIRVEDGAGDERILDSK